MPKLSPATIILESIPPDKKAPTLTSDTCLNSIAFRTYF